MGGFSASNNPGPPLLAALLIPLLLTLAGCKQGDGNDGRGAVSPLKGRSGIGTDEDLQQGFYAIFDLYRDRVVSITTEKTIRAPESVNPFFRQYFDEGPQKTGGLGSGFIISADGYICTNYHVIKGMDRVTVKIKRDEYPAKIIGGDELMDLALLKIEGKQPFAPVFFGDSDRVQVGDWAIAIGNPFGLDRTFTVGIISATVRQDIDELGQNMIQTDASINPGNSGGPLINFDGEVIGINRMIYSKSGGSLGIGFAIPINEARRGLDQLRRHGKIRHGFLGVRIANLNTDIARELGVDRDQGVVIVDLSANGPAARARIKIGDIILKANSSNIKTTRDLMIAVNQTRIGAWMRLTVRRKQRNFQVQVKVGERPNVPR